MNTFYVTTPIYYANSLPHLGHLYTMIVGDTLARAKKQRGIETYFLTGTDEHGINIERAAQKAGRTPKEQADYVVSYYKKMTSQFGLDTEHGGYDIFMRTTEPFHYQGVGELWRRISKAKTPKGNDAIYKGHYEGWFCAACAEYKTEDEYQKPKNEGDPPVCLIHETPLDRVSEESYFFRLSDYDEALLSVMESRPDFVRPDYRRNEVISFVRGGLQDLSVSRGNRGQAVRIDVTDAERSIQFLVGDERLVRDRDLTLAQVEELGEGAPDDRAIAGVVHQPARQLGLARPVAVELGLGGVVQDLVRQGWVVAGRDVILGDQPLKLFGIEDLVELHDPPLARLALTRRAVQVTLRDELVRLTASLRSGNAARRLHQLAPGAVAGDYEAATTERSRSANKQYVILRART